MSKGRNLFQNSEPPAAGERFEELARLRNVTIERIVSSATPDEALYDQSEDEWVVLLRGEALLEIEGKTRQLVPGDTVLLPAHTPHRVRAASKGALWLAVRVYVQV